MVSQLLKMGEIQQRTSRFLPCEFTAMNTQAPPVTLIFYQYTDHPISEMDLRSGRGAIRCAETRPVSTRIKLFFEICFGCPPCVRDKPSVLVTGGVHGYETSGVQGALAFLETEAQRYADRFNICVAPCVSPWSGRASCSKNYHPHPLI